MDPIPRRYRIKNLHQLPQCLSNQSRDLKITVTDFIQDYVLQGIRIQIVHEQLGVLFACVIDSYGTLLHENSDGMIDELSWDVINKELEKFGFLIYYHPKQRLKPDQLSFLVTIHNLGMDKIRPISVKDTHRGFEIVHTEIVTFQADRLPRWLDIKYTPSESEYLKALRQGDAINIKVLSKDRKFSWTWLDYVADIEAILDENGDVSICPDI